MLKREKVEKIAQMLGEMYPNPPVPLDHSDPFTLLVAVLLSAQTTDKKVNEVTPKLFARASTPAEMSVCSVDTLRDLIREIGLAPTKAKNLKAMSTKLLNEFGGQVPNDMSALESLPGVGHKTASVVMAQAFGVPAFPVDTHIHRLARGGVCRRAVMSFKRKKTSSASSQKHCGMISIYRSSFLDASIARTASTT